jgi:hypothetical protein
MHWKKGQQTPTEAGPGLFGTVTRWENSLEGKIA